MNLGSSHSKSTERLALLNKFNPYFIFPLIGYSWDSVGTGLKMEIHSIGIIDKFDKEVIDRHFFPQTTCVAFSFRFQGIRKGDVLWPEAKKLPSDNS